MLTPSSLEPDREFSTAYAYWFVFQSHTKWFYFYSEDDSEPMLLSSLEFVFNNVQVY